MTFIDVCQTAFMTTPAPLEIEAFDELDAILDDLRTRYDETPQWEFCEGFMAAVICMRRPVEADEYLAALLATPMAGDVPDDDGGSFADAAQKERFLTLWNQRWQEVATALDSEVDSLEDDRCYHPEVMDIRGAVAEMPPDEQATFSAEELPAFAQVWALGLSCFLLFIYLYPCAQLPYRYFNKLTVQDGLSNNKVNCILQDKRGFIWIGTNDGLNRYDGKYFTIFRHQPGNTTSLSGNIITSLLQDEQEIIWIGTADGGLSKYNYKLSPAKQFKQYKHIPGDTASIPVNIINAMVQDHFGYLWIGTSGKSVLRFDKKTSKASVSFILPNASSIIFLWPNSL